MNRSFLFISFFILSGYIHAAEEKCNSLATQSDSDSNSQCVPSEENPLTFLGDQNLISITWNTMKKAFVALMELGQIQEARDKEGMTALHYAIKNYASEAHIRSVIKSFYEGRYQKSLIDKKDDKGRTALHWTFDDPSATRYITRRTFLISGWFKTQRLEQGRNTLPSDLCAIIAAYFPSYASWQIDSIRILLDEGADCTIRDSNGKTPRDLALEHNNQEVAQMLKLKLKRKILGCTHTDRNYQYNTKVNSRVHVRVKGDIGLNMMLIYYGSDERRYRIEVTLGDKDGEELHSFTTPNILVKNREDRTVNYQYKISESEAFKAQRVKITFRHAN